MNRFIKDSNTKKIYRKFCTLGGRGWGSSVAKLGLMY